MSNAGSHRIWLCPSCHLHSACNHHPRSAVFPVWIRRLTLIRPLFRRRFCPGSTRTMKCFKNLEVVPRGLLTTNADFWLLTKASVLHTDPTTQSNNFDRLLCHLSSFWRSFGGADLTRLAVWIFPSFYVICQKWQSNSPVTRSTVSAVSALTALVACGSVSVVPYFVIFRYQSSLVRQMRNCYFRNNNRSNGAREVPLCYFYVS